MLDRSVFAARREAYMSALGPGGVALIHAPPSRQRNGDSDYAYRQTSDLYYLTGFAEPETTLVLRPGAAAGERVVMFVRPHDRLEEIWAGRRAGLEGARADHGAELAHPASALPEKLLELVANCEELHYNLGEDHDFDRMVTTTVARLRRLEKRGKRPPRAIVDPRVVLHELRLHKSPEEILVMRKAADISSDAHRAAMAAGRPGTMEYELEALIDFEFRRRGGNGPGYGTIVGAGENATILHYVANACAIAEGDLVLVDAGCEYSYYTADITRTFPASGRFSPAQRRAYDVVLTAQKEAIAMVRPGATIDEIHNHVIRRLTDGMVALGWLPGPAEARVADKTFQRFYMHGTSHWLGMDVHDVGAYTRGGTARPLEAGMVITVEPGLYVPTDADDIAPEYRGLGIRIEDDVLVTADGHQVLTAACPKEIDDVEAACAGGAAGGKVATL